MNVDEKGCKKPGIGYNIILLYCLTLNTICSKFSQISELTDQRKLAMVIKSLLKLSAVCCLFIFTSIFGQVNDRTLTSGSTYVKRDSYFSKPIHLIDLPTASILRGGDLETSIRLYENGGALAKISVGISRYFMLGVAYGGTNMLGGQTVSFNKMPGVQLVYRVIEENLKLPALVVGFDSQGWGQWWTEYDTVLPDSVNKDQLAIMDNRYTVKSRGFYVMMSKAFDPSLIRVGLHGGISLSLEGRNSIGKYVDNDPTVFMAMDSQLSKDITTLFEYDFGINDEQLNGGKGFFNIGLRWALTESMFFEFVYKNILADGVDLMDGTQVPGKVRLIRFSYTSSVK